MLNVYKTKTTTREDFKTWYTAREHQLPADPCSTVYFIMRHITYLKYFTTLNKVNEINQAILKEDRPNLMLFRYKRKNISGIIKDGYRSSITVSYGKGLYIANCIDRAIVHTGTSRLVFLMKS